MKLLNSPRHIDAGFDLFAPGNDTDDIIKFYGAGFPSKPPVNKLDFKICCSAKMHTDADKIYNTGYYMYPRSSLSKTQLRLANSTGIIDAGYRGHLIGMFDVDNMPFTTSRAYTNENTDADFIGHKYDRYLQICAPALNPIIVEIVDSMDELGEETERGNDGLGSSGV
jgi:dUTP pyrophosphatase